MRSAFWKNQCTEFDAILLHDFKKCALFYGLISRIGIKEAMTTSTTVVAYFLHSVTIKLELRYDYRQYIAVLLVTFTVLVFFRVNYVDDLV